MLEDNELKLTINSFLTRKQRQFPDLGLSDDAGQPKTGSGTLARLAAQDMDFAALSRPARQS